MKQSTFTLQNKLSIPLYTVNTVVVGSGAAGLNAAARLYDLGQTDVALVTEGMEMGTSRNTGSDKQTYYKVSTMGNMGESIYDTAHSLWGGGAMDKDIALCEASCSLRAFYRLVELGIPFPHNRYGTYIGYKTDHDPYMRGTSAGPLTSKFMTEALEREVKSRSISILDGYLVVRILKKSDDEIAGLLALHCATDSYVVFRCTNVIYATGGPAGLYLRSVYPGSQSGATGIALEAGVKGKNLTEWQYGIASCKFRWNLSGSYQQVIPRYYSTTQDGLDPQDFLDAWFKDRGTLYDAIFLKGYQWPFDPKKLSNYGSSIIDILIYNEIELKGRRVFMDYRTNPHGCEIDFSLLSIDSYTYLKNIGALFGTPIERLEHINKPAVDLYRAHNIDLYTEPLEIQVSAQHNNGGLAGDIWWQSNIKGFFPVGEVNGTHGIYRPGGSALNSGQVGSLRAAQYIAARRKDSSTEIQEYMQVLSEQIQEIIDTGDAMLQSKGSMKPAEIRKEIGMRMSYAGAFIRNEQNIIKALEETKAQLKNLTQIVTIQGNSQLSAVFRCRDLLIAQIAYLSAIIDYIHHGGRSRGSYLINDPEGVLPLESLDACFRYSIDDGTLADSIQETSYADGKCSFEWRSVRELPSEEGIFETVWSAYRNDGIIC